MEFQPQMKFLSQPAQQAWKDLLGATWEEGGISGTPQPPPGGGGGG